jgi:1-acyl-sn-glycerol-3-phosphate acyltransferase
MLKRNNPDLLDHRDPRFIENVAGAVKRTVWPYHRAEVRGRHRIPRNNGVIYVGNHNGYPYMSEMFIFTSALFDKFGMGRYPYILAHDLPLKLPLLNQLLTSYG